MNDADTLRADGSKTDAYAVFKKMLDKGDPPDDWDSLLKVKRDHPAAVGRLEKTKPPQAREAPQPEGAAVGSLSAAARARTPL